MADTNVLVSALLTEGKPRRFLRACVDGRVVLVLSAGLMEELRDVLRRPKFSMTNEDVHDVLGALGLIAELVEVRSVHRVVSGDPDDDLVINTAIDGQVDAIVTGDKRLLEVNVFQEIPIMTTSSFLETLRRAP